MSDPAETAPEARPVAWVWLLVPAAAQLALHLVTNGRFGLFRDEYYYLACVERPAWGYVDQPPLSIWVLAGWTWLFGDSVQSIRVLPALCGAALVFLVGATTAQLGGGRWGQLLSGLSVAAGAVILVITGFYSMNAFDLLFWLAVYHLLIRIARSGDGRLWIPFGVVLGLGLFNKIGLLVLCAALPVGLLATHMRRQLTDPRLYLGGGIALVFLAPYAIWNALHDWATLEFMANAKAGKIAHFSPLEFFAETALEANPLTLPVWLGGLAWLVFARAARRFRLVALLFVATYVILNLQVSKPYYFAPSVPVMIAAGGVAWERWTSARPARWARWIVLALPLVGGVLIAPMAVPVFSPERTLTHLRRLGISPPPQEIGHSSPLPQYFSDRFGWENLARVVSEVYRELPHADQERCVVLGQNYGHAGAIEYWSRKYPLPPAYSPHNNYWLWGPPPDDTDVLIVVRGDPTRLGILFEEVEEAAVASTPGAIESSMTIWVCRGWRRPAVEVWAEVASFG